MTVRGYLHIVFIGVMVLSPKGALFYVANGIYLLFKLLVYLYIK